MGNPKKWSRDDPVDRPDSNLGNFWLKSTLVAYFKYTIPKKIWDSSQF
jgi:hypothetical protein